MDLALSHCIKTSYVMLTDVSCLNHYDFAILINIKVTVSGSTGLHAQNLRGMVNEHDQEFVLREFVMVYCLIALNVV